MKRNLFIIVFSLVSIVLFAQNVDENIIYYRFLETDNELGLTADQIAKIKKLNDDVAPKFELIGRDDSLSGREKGQRKREIAVMHKKEIKCILSPEQFDIWEKKYGRANNGEGIKKIFANNIDAKLISLEEKYKNDVKNVDNNPLLNKNDKNEQKRVLKNRYKVDKQRLKDQKQTVKNSDLLRR